MEGATLNPSDKDSVKRAVSHWIVELGEIENGIYQHPDIAEAAAVAGGGGLIQVPALFAAYPEAQPATLLGTGKVSAIGGTINAARKYLRYVRLPWALIVPVIIAGFVGSLLGANAVSTFPAEPLRKALPFLLFFLLINFFTFQQ